MKLDLTSFGARGSGRPEDAAANDAAFCAVLEKLEKSGGEIFVPAGTYVFDHPIVLRKTRNVVLRGEGGNYVNPGTRLVYRGNDSAGALHLRTAIHCRIESLCIVADTPAAEAVVRVDAVEDGPSAVSSLDNIFHGCTFRAGPTARPDIRGVDLRDAGHTEFSHCWFQTHAIAASIGAPIRQPAPTISNGQCNNVTFDQCLLFSDLVGERGSNVVMQNCEFATRSDGAGAGIDFGKTAEAEISCVTIRDCFALNGANHRATFFRQGRGAGLVMTNNRIRGYAIAVDLDGPGAAFLAANVFEQTAQGAVDIRLGCPASAVSLTANHHARTIAAGNQAVVHATPA